MSHGPNTLGMPFGGKIRGNKPEASPPKKKDTVIKMRNCKMFCESCGTHYTDGFVPEDKVCTYCGSPLTRMPNRRRHSFKKDEQLMDNPTTITIIKAPVGFREFHKNFTTEYIARNISVEAYYDSCGGALTHKTIIQVLQNLNYRRPQRRPTKAEERDCELINELVCYGVIDPFEFIVDELIRMGIYKP